MARTEAIWSDGKGNPVLKKDAVMVEFLEYDDDGNFINAIEGRVDGKNPS